MAMFLREVWREISGDVMKIVGRTNNKRLERAIRSNTAVSNRKGGGKTGSRLID